MNYAGDLDQETMDWLVANHFEATLAHLRADRIARSVTAQTEKTGMHLLKTRWGYASAMTFGASHMTESYLKKISDSLMAAEDSYYEFKDGHHDRFMSGLADLSSWFQKKASDLSYYRMLKAHAIISPADRIIDDTAQRKAHRTLESLHQAVREWMIGRDIDPDKEVYKTNVCHALQRIERKYMKNEGAHPA